jgi:hypothetical protein
MTIQELRVEALRAAVSVESRGVLPCHTNVFDFAEDYFQWLYYGTPRPGATNHLLKKELAEKEALKGRESTSSEDPQRNG